VDFIEAAQDAARAGMRALVYKPLYFATMDAAYAAEKAVPEVKVFGGVTLDQIAGGLRPATVKIAIKMNAKVIWMPLFDSAHTRARTANVPFYKDRIIGSDSLSIFNSEGQITKDVLEILELLAASPDVVLATSHLSPSESIALIAAAKGRGVEKIVVTHPEANIVGASMEDQLRMVELGAYLNLCWGYMQPKPAGAGQDPRVTAKVIKAVGAENCIMSTDMGIGYAPRPVEGLRCFAEIMMGLDIGQEEIDMMLKQNPAKILGI